MHYFDPIFCSSSSSCIMSCTYLLWTNSSYFFFAFSSCSLWSSNSFNFSFLFSFFQYHSFLQSTVHMSSTLKFDLTFQFSHSALLSFVVLKGPWTFYKLPHFSRPFTVVASSSSAWFWKKNMYVIIYTFDITVSLVKSKVDFRIRKVL